jgi:hypothetical protein
MEIYGNRWTGQAGFWRTIEIRGGTGTVFGNTCDNRGGVTVNYPSFHFIEYGCINKWPRFGNTYQTPVDYPIRDQVGVGMDPIRPASEPYYLWNNSQAGADYILSWVAIPTAAIEQNGGVSFSMQDIIKADRDYFKHTPGSSFNGSSGIGVGTGAQKNAIVATKEGVGFWVTDEGFWDKSSPAADGQLYTWSGSSWMLKYTPYTYPHPLRQESPAQQTPPAPSTLKILQGL